MAAANKLRPIVLSRFVLNCNLPPSRVVFLTVARSAVTKGPFLPKKRMDPDSSTPKLKNAAKKYLAE